MFTDTMLFSWYVISDSGMLLYGDNHLIRYSLWLIKLLFNRQKVNFRDHHLYYEMLLKFNPELFGRAPLFSTKSDISAVPSTAIISVNSIFANVGWLPTVTVVTNVYHPTLAKIEFTLLMACLLYTSRCV